jgi:hypothetical protein
MKTHGKKSLNIDAELWKELQIAKAQTGRPLADLMAEAWELAKARRVEPGQETSPPQAPNAAAPDPAIPIDQAPRLFLRTNEDFRRRFTAECKLRGVSAQDVLQQLAAQWLARRPITHEAQKVLAALGEALPRSPGLATYLATIAGLPVEWIEGLQQVARHL